MNEGEKQLVNKIIIDLVFVVVENEIDPHDFIQEKYGEFGLELLEEFLKEKGI